MSPALLQALAVDDTAEKVGSPCVPPVTDQAPPPVTRASSLPSRAQARLSKVQKGRVSPALLPGPRRRRHSRKGRLEPLRSCNESGPHPVRRASSLPSRAQARLSKVQNGRGSPALLQALAENGQTPKAGIARLFRGVRRLALAPGHLTRPRRSCNVRLWPDAFGPTRLLKTPHQLLRDHECPDSKITPRASRSATAVPSMPSNEPRASRECCPSIGAGSPGAPGVSDSLTGVPVT